MRFNLAATTALLACVLTTPVASSAPVSWGTAFELESESDIDLSYGPIVYAVNGGDNIGNEDFIDPNDLPSIPDPLVVSIGGTPVSFEGIDAVYGLAASFGQLGFPFETFGDATDHIHGSGPDGSNVTFWVENERTVDIPQVNFDPAPATLFNPTEFGTYSVATGNSALDSLLDSQVFMDSRQSLGVGWAQPQAGTLEIILHNLTIGTDYQVQVIGGADDRGFVFDPNIVDPNYLPADIGSVVSPIGTLFDSLGNSVTNVGSFLDIDGDGSGHVTTVLGTFTADATSQQIDYVLQRGRNVGVSAIILTEAGASLSGDFNGDGRVNGVDFLAWQRNPAVGDLADWEANYGNPVNIAANSVPEPSALALTMLGVALGIARRGRK